MPTPALPGNVQRMNPAQQALLKRKLNLPPNLCAPQSPLPSETMKQIAIDITQQYLIPQLYERQSFEPIWDQLLDMYKVRLRRDNLRLEKGGRIDEAIRDVMGQAGDEGGAQVADSLLFDAVDRLKNLNHFISWKDGQPINYSVPRFFNNSREDKYYHPMADKIQQGNGLIKWNIDSQEVYRKHLITAQHHYLYGCAFVLSDWMYELRPGFDPMSNMQAGTMNLYSIGTSFEPISLRRLWLNYRLPVYRMDLQPCPFMFEAVPRFAVLQNPYDPILNPTGYCNLDKVNDANPQWIFTQQEMISWRHAVWQQIMPNAKEPAELVSPQYSVEARWTSYPMIQLDPNTMDYKTYKSGPKKDQPVPPFRYIYEFFGNSVQNGNVIPLRLQEAYWPLDMLPLYGSCHIPDLDSGVYSLSIGEVLWNHYAEICTATNQWLDNKNLMNNPPGWVQIGSPASREPNPNKPGKFLKVTGPNEIGWRQVYDATHSTVEMLNFLKEGAQTTSKAVDAVLGKAMGGRTSATEAQNAFQAAMSGVTTDINLFNYDIMGGFADRVWLYTGMWMPEDILQAITGMYGPPLTTSDFLCRVETKWDVGSTFIESIVKQGFLREVLQAAVSSPVLDQAILWKEFFREVKMPELAKAIDDQGETKEIQIATEQTIKTYLGMPVMISPDQNHQIAIKVKTSFLEDQLSPWNTTYAQQPAVSLMQGHQITRAQAIIDQIQLHQKFADLQMQQALLAQHNQMLMMQKPEKTPPPSGTNRQVRRSITPVNPPENPGQVTQQAQQ